jgi:hypothetical protein
MAGIPGKSQIQETVLYEGGPAKGDLIFGLVLAITLVGLPLAVGAIVRALWLRDQPCRNCSSRNSAGLRGPLAGRAFSCARRSTRRILPEMVLGRSLNSMRRTSL